VQNIGANLLAALLFVAGVLVAAIAVTLLALLVNFIGRPGATRSSAACWHW
jgi:hypothetical protein